MSGLIAAARVKELLSDSIALRLRADVLPDVFGLAVLRQPVLTELANWVAGAPTPIDGRTFDLHTLAAYGDHGVLALFSPLLLGLSALTLRLFGFGVPVHVTAPPASCQSRSSRPSPDSDRALELVGRRRGRWGRRRRGGVHRDDVHPGQHPELVRTE